MSLNTNQWMYDALMEHFPGANHIRLGDVLIIGEIPYVLRYKEMPAFFVILLSIHAAVSYTHLTLPTIYSV